MGPENFLKIWKKKKKKHTHTSFFDSGNNKATVYLTAT